MSSQEFILAEKTLYTVHRQTAHPYQVIQTHQSIHKVHQSKSFISQYMYQELDEYMRTSTFEC